MELPRGMRDLESTELYKIHTIREKFEETADIFGFEMVDPSPIESLSSVRGRRSGLRDRGIRFGYETHVVFMA